jgi:hypothetical protein
LYEHKIEPNRLDLKSFKYFKIRGESEEVAITKVVPNYTLFLHKFSGNFCHPLAIFPVDNLISAVICELKKTNMAAHLSVALRPALGLPVGAILPPSHHAMAETTRPPSIDVHGNKSDPTRTV